ncbi:hypothetical protein ACFC14_18660 [Microbacterium sp. NPDC055988]|uniref:hypothetical protein n=1 Tax=Microbacterium sp. NPDC055988 TaxID=3345671 RepID=UPI0035E148F9
MTERTQKQNVPYNGTDYACTIKRTINADGRPGVGRLFSARTPDGRVKDAVLLDKLRRILDVA